jgi:hypothetical protein
MIERLLRTLNWFARLPNSMAEDLANQYRTQQEQGIQDKPLPSINWWFVGLVFGIGYLVVLAIVVLFQKIKNLKK